ncbi:DNA sulfur modification protein DndB [Candidatus Rariloculus sp.]|uniref:DNA sulfur modification protein DndB n=1 Tax=Candidatus Rariloculus sp. TaxID=3101265 RepID=UPI003D120237
MSDGFEYVFPAIRGIQAQREYYVSMCPMRILPRLFHFDEEELSPELRAQRQLNKARVPELSRYITENYDNYVFSAITVSIDAEVAFERVNGAADESRMGLLRVPMTARYIINDGQHRRAAIERALRDKPELGDETIAVVFFMDKGLERCQQMFADLNRYAIRPSKSLGILYDYRDQTARLAKSLIASSDTFRDVVELEKTSLAARSRRLFTLSAIYQATGELISDLPETDVEQSANLALEFWEAVAESLEEWKRVRRGDLTAGEVRVDFINTHAVVLQSLARMGRALIQQHPQDWMDRLGRLDEIDWRRSNSSLWEGRALAGGRLSKSHQRVILTANAIKTHLGLALLPEEQELEDAFRRGIGESESADG